MKPKNHTNQKSVAGLNGSAKVSKTVKPSQHQKATHLPQPSINVANRIQEAQNQFLQLSNTEGIHNIRLSNIIYLKSENSYTITCIKNQPELIVSKPLSWFEELLSPFGFIRIHSRWLINLFHLQTCCFTANGFLVKMSNEEELKVSRAQKQNLLDALNSISVFNKNKIAAPSTVNQK